VSTNSRRNVSSEETMTDELAVVEPTAPLALFGTSDPIQVIAAASSVATALAEVVNARKLYAIVNGKKFPTVEAWTLLGSMLGVFPITEWVHELRDDNGNVRGFEARVVAKTFGGRTVGAGEARCIRGESKTWHAGAQEFALASMAQTRATSKALRGPLDFVFKLAGFQPTPAEEMTSVVEATVVDGDGVVQNPSVTSVEALKTAQETANLPIATLPVPSSGHPTPQSGPRAKRGNVVKAPQGAQSERSEVVSQINTAAPKPPEMVSGGQKTTSAMTSASPVRLDDDGPTPLSDEIAKMQAMVDEMKAKAKERDGRAVYLNSLREQAREAAALLRQLRVRSQNVGATQPVPLPPATPNTSSDESLQVYIAARGEKEKAFKGQTLATLGEKELQSVVDALEELTAKVSAKLQ
jgi:hypothetical protein